LIKLKRELGSAESNVLGVNAARGMEAVHNDAERLKRELDEVTSQVRSLYEKQNKNDTHINQLGVQIVEKQKKISEALRLAEVRKQDEKQRRILEEKLPGMKQQITELSETIADAKLVLPTMDAEEQELIRQQRQTEASSETRLDGMRSSLADLSRMRNAIEQ
jgi:chromosome segregation ATPase